MKTFPSESVDCIITDPPYGYSFMGKDWDRAVPSVDVWKECLRVLKSGAFAFVMSSPRQDVLSQMIVRLEQAGFDIGFTSLLWTYASGFPKSENISLQIDKRECLKQLSEKLGRKPTRDQFKEAWKTFRPSIGERHRNVKPFDDDNGWNQNDTSGDYVYTKAVTSEAQKLDGCYGGFQPKPAVEVIIVCMKPLSEKTYVDQALKNGKGVTWLDNARIPTEAPVTRNFNDFSKIHSNQYGSGAEIRTETMEGRFPANLLVSDDVLNDGKERKSQHIEKPCNTPNLKTWGGTIQTNRGERGYDDVGSFSRYFDLDTWFEKTIENLPEEVKKTFPFLICPKASKSERNKGCENIEPKAKCNMDKMGGSKCTMKTGSGNDRNVSYTNFHPTVKPLKLMSYLVTLGSRAGDIVLDPFVGSGTTCLATKMLGRNWLGIEISKEYCKIASARLGGVKAIDVNGVPLPSIPSPTTTQERRPTGTYGCGYDGKCGYRSEDGSCLSKRSCKDKRVPCIHCILA